MKTGDLIRALAADAETRTASPQRALALALIPGVAIAFGLYFAALGLRPHLFALLGENPRLVFKLCLTFLLACLSGRFVLRLVRPGADARGSALLLAVAPALLAIANLVELLTVPAALWSQRLVGSNAIHCLESIPFLGAVPLVAALLALRHGAPEHPALAGAGAGLLAGAIGAALYATHCPDDSPFFVATWYTLAIAIVAAVGALVGARLLRW